MKVSFDPGDYQPDGTIAFLSWSNSELHAALRTVFRESPRERIVEIVVERSGIKAVFEKRD